MESITLMFHELKPIFSHIDISATKLKANCVQTNTLITTLRTKLLLLQCWLRENDYFIGIVYQLVIDYIDVTGSFKKDYFYEM